MRRPFPADLAAALLALFVAGCSSKTAPPNDTSVSESSAAARATSPAPTAKPRPRESPLCNVEVPDLDKLVHKPLFVVTERDPWAMVIGSDVPTAVLYEDGLVLYQKIDGKRAEAMRGQWTPDQARSFVDELAKAGFLEVPLRESL